MLFGMNNIPVLGATNWRLRALPVFRAVMQGGVYHPDAIPPALLREMNAVGNRPGHYRAFMSLIRHFPEWDKDRSDYGAIEVPVLFIYGDHDWSHPEERAASVERVPGAVSHEVRDAGHFLSLDAPGDAVREILRFARPDVQS